VTDLTPVWTALVGAVLVGSFTLAAAMLSQRMSAKSEREREERAAARERLIRSREMAEAAREAADALRRHVLRGEIRNGATMAEMGDWVDAYGVPDLRKYGGLILDAALRVRIETAADYISRRFDIETFAGDSTPTVTWKLASFAWDSLSAFLRDEALPAAPQWIAEYASAVADGEHALGHDR
jgi:hypothetical protein